MNKLQNVETMEKVNGEVMEYTQRDKELYEDLCQMITAEQRQINFSALTIAKSLYAMHKNGLYQIEGYPNIYDIATSKFHIGRTSCHNALSICQHFGQNNPETGECRGLRPEYEAFSHSQLIEMAHLPKEIREDITPEMSVREIRRIRQAHDPDRASKKNRKKKHGRRPRRRQLLKTEDIRETLDREKENLFSQIDAFTQEHPSAKYRIAITLLYEE